jgi:hypothetical protein
MGEELGGASPETSGLRLCCMARRPLIALPQESDGRHSKSQTTKNMRELVGIVVVQLMNHQH